MTGFDDINDVIASNPALSWLIDGACQNMDSLNAGEAALFNFLLRCYANQWWKLFKLFEDGSTSIFSGQLLTKCLRARNESTDRHVVTGTAISQRIAQLRIAAVGKIDAHRAHWTNLDRLRVVKEATRGFVNIDGRGRARKVTLRGQPALT